MQLSLHYTLQDLCLEPAHQRSGAPLPRDPVILDGLRRVATDLLDPLVVALGAPRVIGAYFDDDGPHAAGRAVDLRWPEDPQVSLHKVAGVGLAFDRLALECVTPDPITGWLHLEVAPAGVTPRGKLGGKRG